MGGKTKIEWTDVTWNPVTGCSKESEGCRHCYAESLARRFREDFKPWTTPNAAHNVRLHPERFEQPLHWRKPRRVFVCSMGDLFHVRVPFGYIDDVFCIMAEAKQHTFQILTKRPDRMKDYIYSLLIRLHHKENAPGGVRTLDWRWPLPNVWLGVSAEDQKTFDERVPLLLQTPAAKRFVSLEPLLRPIDLRRVRIIPPKRPRGTVRPIADWIECDPLERTAIDELGVQYPVKQGLDWVIVGGESGPGARPMHPDWVRDIRDQCQAADIPFFFKQWGAWVAASSEHRCTGMRQWGTLDIEGNWFPVTTPWNGRQGLDSETNEYVMVRVGKKRAGRVLDGRTWDEMPGAE